MKVKDLTGQKFGMLTVVKIDSIRNGNAYFECRCDCGDTHVTSGQNLKRGATKSCGCITHDYSHGMSDSITYKSWASMKERCNNPNHVSYPHYGALGIKYVPEWANFEAFFADMGERPSKNYQLDRIDPDGNYTPENCRWATKLQNARNKRRVKRITYNGKTQTIKEWAKEIGLNYQTLFYRISIQGWDIKRALTEPVNK